MNDAEAVRIIRETLPDVLVVYRFGSSAAGESRPESDVDLAVLTPRPLDPVARFTLQERLAVALRRDVDLVDLASASTVMRMQVVSRGIAIAAFDDAQKDRFEVYVYSAYARLNEERKAILEDVLREGTVHGR